jgi:hypothetical protein
MSEDKQQRSEFRQPVLAFLQSGYADLDADCVVIGFGLVVEVLDKNGERGIHKCTSDAGGQPLPWYLAEAFSRALECEDEIDEAYEEEDDE